eukprot:CAMPEP_0184338732 /NCGR_PEP_ID=MMETSP1089-20130417/7331_1 /TAXON_ID=38269 ORGANISM="Gloeochaete wittrockiana, Strain SAG46.84" /NCGR_SAMPLE_ID=MMETSP1089 /ASSEMBLY_ACC=CAM_ASM_000445 /LENGTH=355 /DNA_ID=CAMNT_0026665471 /DNA_START=210 /DNA_END=1274 /DNA_ORIENTATION=+
MDMVMKSDNGLPPVLLLPDPLMLEIISLLSPVPDWCRLSQVCRSWRRILNSNFSEMCHDINLSCFRAVPISRVVELVQCAPNLRSFSYGSRELLSRRSSSNAAWNTVLEALARDCLHLTSLTLVDVCSLDDAVLTHLFQRLGPVLQQVSLSGMPLRSRHSLEAIGLFCPALEVLDLSECQGANDMAVSTIAKGCPHLRWLSLASCYSVSDSGVAVIAQWCSSTMQHLDLNCCEKVTNKGILYLAQYMPNLVHLSLNACSKVNDHAVSCVAEKCKKLQHLDLSFLPSLSDASFYLILTKLPQLQHLSLTGCRLLSDVPLKRAYEKQCCGNLKFVDLKYCERMSINTLADLRSQCPS